MTRVRVQTLDSRSAWFVPPGWGGDEIYVSKPRDMAEIEPWPPQYRNSVSRSGDLFGNPRHWGGGLTGYFLGVLEKHHGSAFDDDYYNEP